MKKRRRRKSVRHGKPQLQNWMPALLLGSFLLPLLILVYLYCDLRASEAQFLLIDGVFQTLDPLRRLFAGQVFFRDFVSYLGIGHTLMYVPLFWVFGQDLYASMFSAHFVACFSTGASLSLVAWAVFRSWRWGLILATFLIAHSIFNPTARIDLLAPAFLDPGISGRPIRIFLPTFVAIVLYLVWPRLVGDDRRSAIHRALTMAGLGAVAIFYSNDYGFPVAATLPLVFILLRPGNLNRGIELGVYVLSLPIFAFLIGNLLTVGHLGDWYRYNFEWVARSQFWYFEDYTRKLIGLDDWLQFWTFQAAYKVRMLICLPILVYAWFRKPQAICAPSILLFLGLSHLLSATLTQFGSWRDGGYEIGLVLEYPFIELYCVIFLLNLLPWRRRWDWIQTHREQIQQVAFAVGALGVAAFVCRQAMRFQEFAEAVELGMGKRPIVAGLGRTLDPERTLDFQLLEKLKPQLGSGSVISEYSGLDLLGLGKISDSRAGLLIHAFGGDRDAIVSRLQSKSAALVSTVSTRFTNWIEWSLRQNWWFYKPLYENYQLVAASPGYLYWKPRADPWVGGSEKLKCHWTESRGRYFFTVARETNQPKWKENALAEVTLDLRVGELTGYRKLLQRELLLLEFPETPIAQSITVGNGLRIGRPVTSGPFQFPVEVRSTGKVRFEMSLRSTFPREISIESCAVKPFASMSAIRPPRAKPYAPAISE